MSERLLGYADLHNSLARIGRQFDSPARPVPRDLDLSRGDAYLVAGHASVEYFFENICRKALHASLWQMRFRGRPNRILASIHRTFLGARVQSLPSGDPPFYNSLESAIAASAKWYVQRVDKNNGVKSSNLYAILLPLGFREADFDPVWLAAMDSFGAGRGDMAHGRPTSPVGRPPVLLGPSGATSVSVWTQEALRPRNAAPPWEVRRILTQIQPEMLAWDQRLHRRI